MAPPTAMPHAPTPPPPPRPHSLTQACRTCTYTPACWGQCTRQAPSCRAPSSSTSAKPAACMLSSAVPRRAGRGGQRAGVSEPRPVPQATCRRCACVLACWLHPPLHQCAPPACPLAAGQPLPIDTGLSHPRPSAAAGCGRGAGGCGLPGHAGGEPAGHGWLPCHAALRRAALPCPVVAACLPAGLGPCPAALWLGVHRRRTPPPWPLAPAVLWRG